ncbi:probable 2-carboxy-D-arabinitol-1-phosphatase [Chenopodium quinoa]|uniref:2-carboxy-D-arabinitol-1-phosphatase n=1 Tax=Chenopodium quinoa TaxID=63459 RepID=A0A803M654_CHEQI|nr:probable 2-carboxy-D-arabinitol-1-phosphatase [Chenopodium quinoa]
MLAISPSSFLIIPKSSQVRISSALNPKFSTIRSSSSVNEAVLENRQPESSADFPAIKAAKRVVLVRHGQSTWNAEGRIQGSSNFSVLTTKGEAQAETSRQMLLEDSFDVCFTSPLTRSKRTAEIIWGSRKEPMIPDVDLREIDLYIFQGLLKHEGEEKFGTAFRQWKLDAPNFVIDGHYPVRELWTRARSCWDRILAHQSNSVLVVAHNAVNQALVATAIGLGTEYFRVLLQSNCGVSVLDFIPQAENKSPYICLNRLNQTPNSPIAAGSSAGRKASKRIILVTHGSLVNNEANLPRLGNQPLSMLGSIQSQKTAELLLDLKVDTVVSSPGKASMETAQIISKTQEAAESLGADSVPRYVNVKEMKDLDVETMLGQLKQGAAVDSILQPSLLDGLGNRILSPVWDQTGKVWQTLLDELSGSSEVVVVVGHPTLHIALMTHCLNLSEQWLGSFHLDEGSISVIDFPDGPSGKGIIRCINYTAHLGRWSIPITKPTLDEEEMN